MDILINFMDTGALGGLLTYKHVIMLIVGGIFLYLAIAKQYEPLLLVPIGFQNSMNHFYLYQLVLV